MSQVERQELEQFRGFYRRYYEDDIAQLAQRYPNERRSLYVSYDDLYRFDADLAERYLNKPEDIREIAEEALRTYDLPADVSLGQAHVRLEGLPAGNTIDIRNIRVVDDHIGSLVAVQGIVRKATDVRPKIVEAAFECQRCGTMTYIPQSDAGFQEPHECQGCERQGPFRINHDQSEFVDAQTIRVQESPEGLRGGETPQAIDIYLEDDVCGQVTPGDHVSVAGVLHIEQQTSGNEKTALFDLYMDGVTVTIEDEEFEDMDISDEDVTEILELADSPDIYQKMIDSVAPSIYGYEQEKQAMILQLFGGVTKHLPDESRIRGDLHILLIGDPGTGKSQLLSYTQNIAPRSVYTSGKGSSAAGLCVTGDTLVHTTDGIRRIEDIVTPDIPESVETETAVEREHDLYTYDEATGETTVASTSHVWRMPPKPCRRIETASGIELETSQNTPVLTCGDDGPEWTPISEVEAGDHVAAPKFDEIERSSPPVDEYVEYTNEKLDLTDDSVECLRDALTEQFGTLRDAAAALDFSEDFVYDTLSNRHVPVEHLDRIVAETSADWDDIEVKRAMLRHGDSVEIPTEFGADLMYLLGLTFGDGDIALSRRGENRGMIRISNGDEVLLQRAVESIQSVFGKCVEIERQEERVPCVRLHSATVARLFDNVGMTTPKENLALDSQLTTAEHADAFLRGLMDADGSVSERDGGGSSIHFSTISEELARQVRVMLQTYGVQARVRERDRRGEFAMVDGQTIESNHVQYHVEVYGSDIECYAEAIGFESEAKRAALERVAQGVTDRGDRLPIGSQLAAADVPVAGSYHNVVVRGDDPGRGRAVAMQQDLDLGEAEQLVESVTDSDLRWQEVVAAVDTGEKELYDLTVPETNNFVANGVVTHNTAAAVRDDFGDGQQWTLEAGALVLADKGVAAIDELDKMAEDDRSAMHEALEQQSISISKAGINATLKSRCSLLGAANPKYGRFDQYEPIGEQIDLEPTLISRFDLIFTVTDQPDPDHDARLADHILTTNYAGELNTQQTEMTNSEVTRQQVENVQEEVAPVVDAELLRKYVAYSKRTCYPRMTDAARDAIQEFYVDLRSKGADEDAPVPVTARKLEATVRLAEASARVRLADEVTAEDAERVIDIVRSCLQDIGVDPETGEFDADVVETGTSKSQRDRIKGIKDLLREVDEEYEDEPGAPRERVMERADEVGMEASKVEDELEKLKTRGDVYLPDGDHIKLV